MPTGRKWRVGTVVLLRLSIQTQPILSSLAPDLGVSHAQHASVSLSSSRVNDRSATSGHHTSIT